MIIMEIPKGNVVNRICAINYRIKIELHKVLEKRSYGTITTQYSLKDLFNHN